MGIGHTDHRADDRRLDATGQIRNVHAVHGVRASVDRDDKRRRPSSSLGVEGPLGLLGRPHTRRSSAAACRSGEAQLHVAVYVVRGVGRRLRKAAVEELRRPSKRPPRTSPTGPGPGALARRDAPDRPHPVRPASLMAQATGSPLSETTADDRVVVPPWPSRLGRTTVPPRRSRRPQHVGLEAGVPELRSPRRRGAGTREVHGRDARGWRRGRCLRQHAVRQGVLLGDPRAGRRRVGVERPVRVGDPVAVVLVDLVGGRGRWVGQPRRRRHRVIRGQDRPAPRPRPRDDGRRGPAWPCGRRTAPRTGYEQAADEDRHDQLRSHAARGPAAPPRRACRGGPGSAAPRASMASGRNLSPDPTPRVSRRDREDIPSAGLARPTRPARPARSANGSTGGARLARSSTTPRASLAQRARKQHDRQVRQYEDTTDPWHE